MSKEGHEPRYVGTNWDKVKVEAKNGASADVNADAARPPDGCR